MRFGATGLHGTSTETIARDVGRLAAVPLPPLRHEEGALHGRRAVGLPRHAGGLPPAGEQSTDAHDAFRRIGDAYLELISDRRYLDIQLQAYATTDDADVRKRGPGRLRRPCQRGGSAHPRDTPAAGLLPGPRHAPERATAMGVAEHDAGWPAWIREGCIGGFGGLARADPFFRRELVSSHYLGEQGEHDRCEDRSIAIWTFAVTSVALVMVMLDNLVVSTALNVIREELGATHRAARVDRQRLHADVRRLPAHRRRAGRPLRPAPHVHHRRRGLHGLLRARGDVLERRDAAPRANAAQGIGAAIVTPLTLTLLSAAVPSDRRGLALGGWGAVGGLAIAIGPLVGGAIVEGMTWNWIFWVNVPIGIALIPLAWFGAAGEPRAGGSAGPARRGAGSVGLFGIVWALVNGNSRGLDEPAHRGRLRRWRRLPGRLRVVGATRSGSHAADALLPSRTFSFANLVGVPHELRDVRGHLPAGPVPPVRALLLPARGRRAPSCPGRSHRCSWRRSPARCPTASAAGSSWAWA